MDTVENSEIHQAASAAPARKEGPPRRRKRRESDSPAPDAPLRHGFTTGTAASAASAAAVHLLYGAALGSHITVGLPPFDVQGNPTGPYDVPLAGGKVLCAGSVPSPESLAAMLHEAGVCPVASAPEDSPATAPCAFQGGGWLPQPHAVCAVARVVKDGGDDPDATHKAGIVACACAQPFVWQHAAECSTAEPCSQQPCPVLLPVMVPGVQVVLYVGAGIGRVTLPGLPVVVGEPAVNPVPRQQISLAVATACEQRVRTAQTRTELPVSMHVLLWVEQGEGIARNTLNPRLGIVGGISILGTQGTVKPYSHDAWQATIVQGLEVAKAVGVDTLLLSTGRRSERLLFSLYPHLPAAAGVQAADFAQFSIKEAALRGFPHIVWGCFVGKLLKLAQGLEYTHAHSAPADMPMLVALCQQAGGSAALVAQVAAMPTAQGAFAIMQEHSPPVAQAVLRVLAAKAYAVLARWYAASSSSNASSASPVVLHVLSIEGKLLYTYPEKAHHT